MVEVVLEVAVYVWQKGIMHQEVVWFYARMMPQGRLPSPERMVGGVVTATKR